MKQHGGVALVAGCLAVPLITRAAAGQGAWPIYGDETAERLMVAPGLGANDPEEKDYTWGDLDHDGDVDLICVRKEPWNTPGRRRNLLLMNEGVPEGHAIDGVLVDRTDAYATASDAGGNGFLDQTNDRDVALVDVDGDGWLDVVTSTTYGERLPKMISHPRVYMNLGEIDGDWQGFRYEASRTPTMPITPHFCGVGFGDVNNDTWPDLYFVDYNNDLEDRLWINDGAGNFVDETLARVPFVMRESDFGVHAVLADMNGDGVRDIVKDRGSTDVVPPLRVSISYNDLASPGFFNLFEVIHEGNPYHVEVGDLNGDGRLDVVIDDDGIDRYLLNQGNDAQGRADFIAHQFPPQSDSFGGNIVIRDLNQDSHPDVIIADVDVDCCGCARHMHFWASDGNVPDVSFSEETGGIPISARTGTHDVAVFDIDGDGWDDMVIGTCTGTSVWIVQPQLVFTYPEGLPGDVPPDEPVDVTVTIRAMSGDGLDASSPTLRTSVNGGVFETSALAPLGGDLYRMTLPAAGCLDRIDFYVAASTLGGAAFTDPADAPATTHRAIASLGTDVSFADDMEGDVSAWTIVNDPLLTSGAWEVADPNGTLVLGQLAAPEDDATPDGGVRAFVTQNGASGGSASADDVDGGWTWLVSPVLDLVGQDATVSYQRWFFCDDEGDPTQADVLRVAISADGGSNWVPIASHTTGGTGSAWESVSFVVSEHVAPTATVLVRFGTADLPNNSVTEAGIDEIRVGVCPLGCVADIDGDGVVGFSDVLSVLGAWGPCPPECPQDLDRSGDVGFGDVLTVLAGWGPCPG